MFYTMVNAAVNVVAVDAAAIKWSDVVFFVILKNRHYSTLSTVYCESGKFGHMPARQSYYLKINIF